MVWSRWVEDTIYSLYRRYDLKGCKEQQNTRCGAPVLRESRMIDYPYQCMNCDEDLYHFEVRKHERRDRCFV